MDMDRLYKQSKRGQLFKMNLQNPRVVMMSMSNLLMALFFPANILVVGFLIKVIGASETMSFGVVFLKLLTDIWFNSFD
jgi:uncharacterized membrane protein (DUF106 family)